MYLVLLLTIIAATVAILLAIDRARCDIIKAMGNRVDPATIDKLSSASDKLEKATNEFPANVAGENTKKVNHI